MPRCPTFKNHCTYRANRSNMLCILANFSSIPSFLASLASRLPSHPLHPLHCLNPQNMAPQSRFWQWADILGMYAINWARFLRKRGHLFLPHGYSGLLLVQVTAPRYSTWRQEDPAVRNPPRVWFHIGPPQFSGARLYLCTNVAGSARNSDRVFARCSTAAALYSRGAVAGSRLSCALARHLPSRGRLTMPWTRAEAVVTCLGSGAHRVVCELGPARVIQLARTCHDNETELKLSKVLGESLAPKIYLCRERLSPSGSRTFRELSRAYAGKRVGAEPARGRGVLCTRHFGRHRPGQFRRRANWGLRVPQPSRWQSGACRLRAHGSLHATP